MGTVGSKIRDDDRLANHICQFLNVTSRCRVRAANIRLCKISYRSIYLLSGYDDEKESSAELPADAGDCTYLDERILKELRRELSHSEQLDTLLTNFGDSDLKILEKNPGLTRLNLTGVGLSPSMPSVILTTLSHSCPDLEDVSLFFPRNCTFPIPSEVWRVFGEKCSKITKFHMNLRSIADIYQAVWTPSANFKGIEVALKHWKALEHLTVDWSKKFLGELSSSNIPPLDSLVTLEVRGSVLTPRTLEKLDQFAPNLKNLDVCRLRGFRRPDEDVIDELKERDLILEIHGDDDDDE